MKFTVRTGTVEEVVDLSLEIPEFENPYSASEYYQRLKKPFLILIAESGNVPIGFAEKFAELLIKECAMIVEGFEITQEVALDEYVDYEASAVLKEHFGVEE